MLEWLRTIAVAGLMSANLAYITLGASLAYFEGAGVWTSIVNSGWCPQTLCKTDTWQR